MRQPNLAFTESLDALITELERERARLRKRLQMGASPRYASVEADRAWLERIDAGLDVYRARQRTQRDSIGGDD